MFDWISLIFGGFGNSIISFIVKITFNRKSSDDYIAISSLITINLAEKSGRQALYEKSVHGKCIIDAIGDIKDVISVDGTHSIVGMEGVKLKSTSRIIGHSQIDVFELVKTVGKGNEFKYTIQRELYDSFTSDSEYWETEQYQFNKFIKITIIFPKDRKYKSFSGKIRRKGNYILPPNQLREIMVKGRPALEWVFHKNTVGDNYRIEWEW